MGHHPLPIWPTDVWELAFPHMYSSLTDVLLQTFQQMYTPSSLAIDNTKWEADWYPLLFLSKKRCGVRISESEPNVFRVVATNFTGGYQSM